MPICHISCKTVSHATGRTAPAAAAYRAADRIKNERDGRTHDYTRKAGVAHAEIIVPAGTPKPTRAELWNAAEKADTRKNSTVAREWEIALPCELPAQERKALALEFGRWLCATYGVAADVAIHEPNAKGDQRNHHAHVLTTTRHWGDDGQLKEKTRIFDAKETGAKEVAKVRKEWEMLCNRALERAGRDERISAGKLPDGQTATIHVGVGAKAITRKGGEVSSRERHNEQVMELRRVEAELAAAKAAEQQSAVSEPEPTDEEILAQADAWEKELAEAAKAIREDATKRRDQAWNAALRWRAEKERLDQELDEVGLWGTLTGKQERLEDNRDEAAANEEKCWRQKIEAEPLTDERGARYKAEKVLREKKSPAELDDLDKCLDRATLIRMARRREEESKQREAQRERDRQRQRQKNPGRGRGMTM